jgi:SAM-dependent methyltransferase
MDAAEKIILDPCCGGRMFWFDKQNPRAIYGDNRQICEVLCNGRVFSVKPDIMLDFTSLPFEDETFWHVIFDPPHITHGGDASWIVKKYGKLPRDWRYYIRAGFSECLRVLKTNGTLIFKWSEDSVTVGDIIKAIGWRPLYGQKERKGKGTHWMCFVKGATEPIASSSCQKTIF